LPAAEKIGIFGTNNLIKFSLLKIPCRGHLPARLPLPGFFLLPSITTFQVFFHLPSKFSCGGTASTKIINLPSIDVNSNKVSFDLIFKNLQIIIPLILLLG